MRRTTNRRLLASAGALLVALAPIATAPARADDSASLLGYTLHATAPGIEIVYDTSQLPAPTHPLFTGTLPEATADLETGPSGRGFGSLLWPGSLAGNLGTTVQQLNQLCPPGQLTSLPVIGPQLQCLPVTPEMKALLAGSNDPMRAEARSPAGPAEASYGAPGALYMTAHAVGTVVTADSGIGAFNGAPVLSIGAVTSHAASTVSGTLATATATSSISGLTIGKDLPVPGLPIPAGIAVLAIDSITTLAKSASDGTTGTPTASLEITGVRVLGVPATIDSTGIHLADQSQSLEPVLAPVRALAEQALAQLKFHATTVAEPVLKKDGSAAGATVAGVVISFATPEGATYQITLGKAVAGADASPAFSIDLGGLTSGDNFPSTSLADVLPADVGGISLPAFESPSATGGAPAVNQPGVAVRNLLPGGKAIAPMLVLLGTVLAAALAFGLKRVSDVALGETASTTECPNPSRS